MYSLRTRGPKNENGNELNAESFVAESYNKEPIPLTFKPEGDVISDQETASGDTLVTLELVPDCEPMQHTLEETMEQTFRCDNYMLQSLHQQPYEDDNNELFSEDFVQMRSESFDGSLSLSDEQEKMRFRIEDVNELMECSYNSNVEDEGNCVETLAEWDEDDTVVGLDGRSSDEENECLELVNRIKSDFINDNECIVLVNRIKRDLLKLSQQGNQEHLKNLQETFNNLVTNTNALHGNDASNDNFYCTKYETKVESEHYFGGYASSKVGLQRKKSDKFSLEKDDNYVIEILSND